MDAHALTTKTVRDGLVCTLILHGDLDFLETGGFLEHAALPSPARPAAGISSSCAANGGH